VNRELIGVISDTHGLVRPEALNALDGVSRIIHAGDIGKPEVLERLGELAPVIAVRGNVDRGEWAAALPESRVFEIGRLRGLVLHNLKELSQHQSGEGIDLIISGHSHQPLITRRNGVLFVNPGSAGPRRFKLPISLALLRLDGEKLEAKLITLAS
jgi:putative phosphoesterase